MCTLLLNRITSNRFVIAVTLISLLFVWKGNARGLQETSSAAETAKPAAEEVTTWLVLRHAERDGDNDALTDAGKARAEVLQQLGSILNVSAVYSTDFARTKGTVQPLADLLGQEIQLYERTSDQWFEKIRLENQGGVVMIVGHSNTAGVIAGKLAGVEPLTIGHDEYDSLFVVTTNGSQSSLVRLKYGQGSTGAPSASPENMGPIKSPKIP